MYSVVFVNSLTEGSDLFVVQFRLTQYPTVLLLQYRELGGRGRYERLHHINVYPYTLGMHDNLIAVHKSGCVANGQSAMQQRIPGRWVFYLVPTAARTA